MRSVWYIRSVKKNSDLAARMLAAQPALCRRARRRDAFVDVFRAVAATAEPAAIATVAIQHVSAWIPAPSWAVLTADLAGDISVLAERGVPPAMASVPPLVAGWTLQSRQLFLTASLRRDRRIACTVDAAAMGLPLACRGRCFGAIVGFDAVASTRAPRLSRDADASLTLLIEPIATTLDMALMLKRAEALSVTDDLTRLYNSRYLNQVLRRETKRATRGGRPLSLLFVDLDSFKVINDTYGHLFGSRALVEAAAVISSSARETDVVARFGGDEFALVLPDTGGPGAFAVADRICERLAAHRFLAASGLNEHLTASVGIASFPEVAGSADELVQAADSAMYVVKARGKNGIQAALVPTDK